MVPAAMAAPTAAMAAPAAAMAVLSERRSRQHQGARNDGDARKILHHGFSPRATRNHNAGRADFRL
jgi:hypothetical protein